MCPQESKKEEKKIKAEESSRNGRQNIEGERILKEAEKNRNKTAGQYT